RELPERRDEEPEVSAARFHSALALFKKQVSRRYSEGTLQRLLQSGDAETCQAAVLALGLVGSMASNAALASCLHEDDERLRDLAANALWAIWFRGDSEDNNQELQRLLRLKDRGRTLAGLDALIERAPNFAESYNQRAIIYFQMKAYERAV